MLKYRNFGKKSLAELGKVLEGYGLHFGMDASKVLGKPKEGEESEGK
jgi:DNA-directed RNA polymerase subunit alpha